MNELNDLDEEIEKDDVGYVMTSGFKANSDSGSNEDDILEKKSKAKLQDLALLMMGNINAGK